MGCDIHIYTEIKNDSNGIWESFHGKHFTDYFSTDKTSTPFDNRSYLTFAFLSGVRNNSLLKPIKKATGMLPKNISSHVKSEWENWESDGHSRSFLTARELVEFDYSKNFRTGRTVRRVLFEKTRPKLKFFYDDDEESYYDYYDLMGYPDSNFFINIQELAMFEKLDNVRLVFWFDN